MPAQKRTTREPEARRRRSSRLSQTPKKSTYFENDESEDEYNAQPASKRKRGQHDTKRRAKDDNDSEDQFEDDGEASEPSEVSEVSGNEGGEDEKEEDEDEDDDDDDAPMRVEIIPLAKMRDTGGVDYEDHKLHMNTILFLKDLKSHNQRSWLRDHDGEYRRALKDWQSFVERTTETIMAADDTIPELPVKDVSFRIHRDIRFSKDPTPYKPYFSAAWSRTGRKGPYACYYLHCEPGKAFVGGGLWDPEREALARLRRSIDRRPRRWRDVLGGERLRGVFFPGVAAGEQAVEAFVRKSQRNALKIRPMGYEPDHRDIALLRLKCFTVGASIKADMLCADDAQERLRRYFEALAPLVTFLNSIVMPDRRPLQHVESSDDEDGA